MTNILKIDHENRTIIMDRAFAKFASIVGSKEYNLLQDARHDSPEYSVIRRTIRRKPDKESYKGLTYSYMEAYIQSHSNAADRMADYNEMRMRAKCHSIRYANIKAWFIKPYPEINDFSAKNEQCQVAERIAA